MPLGQHLPRCWMTAGVIADEFYRSITPPKVGKDAAAVIRQALAGMLWTKQYYVYDVKAWLQQHGIDPGAGQRGTMRNSQWFHMLSEDIISMPDKWEYPWFAAWDLAFHSLAFSMVDLDFAKSQLTLMFDDLYLHPNGQMPAYEWNFGDVNPPVHAWATYFLYTLEKQARGKGDLKFLEQSFQKPCAELHLVGQPEGPERQQRIRRRVLRAG